MRSLDLVGVAPGRQPLDQGHHLLDVPGGSRVDIRRPDPQRGQVLEKGCDVLCRVDVNVDPLLLRFADDPVLDVRQVADVGDFVALGFQKAMEQVLEEDGPEVADVGEVVHRRSAGVHAHVARFQGGEFLDPPGGRVVQPQGGHPIGARRATAWAAMPSPRPSAPRWSVVFPLRLTSAPSRPRASASDARIFSR